MIKKRVRNISNRAMVDWVDVLEKFLLYKRAQGKSDLTLEDYRRHVTQFFRKYDGGLFSYDQLKENVYEYFSDLDIKPATYNNRLVYLKAFFTWCLGEEILVKNPLLGFKKRKDEGRIVNVEHKILKQLLDLPDRGTFAGLRDYCLILLTLDTGIRPKEAFSLLPADFNTELKQIVIRAEKAKTRTTRILPISLQTVKALKQLLLARHPDWVIDTPIFCTWEGKYLNRHTWGDRMEHYSNQLGFKIRPYDLRHCFSLNFLRNGASVFALQKALGHSDLTITKRYVALTDDDLREQHTNSTPINMLISDIKRVGNVSKAGRK